MAILPNLLARMDGKIIGMIRVKNRIETLELPREKKTKTQKIDTRRNIDIENWGRRLIFGLVTLFLSVTFMMIAYSGAIYLLFGEKKAWILIALAALACFPVTLYGILQFPLLVELIYSTYGPGIFGKHSNRLIR